MLSLHQHSVTFRKNVISSSTQRHIPQKCYLFNTASHSAEMLSLHQHSVIFRRNVISSSTQRHIPQKCDLFIDRASYSVRLPSLHQQRCENLRSYTNKRLSEIGTHKERKERTFIVFEALKHEYDFVTEFKARHIA
jgi:hypothetical protein